MSSDMTFTYRGIPITVLDGSPYLMDGTPTEQAVEYAVRLLERLDDLRQFAAKHLLDVYNDTWSDEDEPPMDEKTFATKLVDPEIALYHPGADTVYFHDSDLFWGHGIAIRVEGTTRSMQTLLGRELRLEEKEPVATLHSWRGSCHGYPTSERRERLRAFVLQ